MEWKRFLVPSGVFVPLTEHEDTLAVAGALAENVPSISVDGFKWGSGDSRCCKEAARASG